MRSWSGNGETLSTIYQQTSLQAQWVPSIIAHLVTIVNLQTFRVGLNGGRQGCLQNFHPCFFQRGFQTMNRSVQFSADIFLWNRPNAVVHNVQTWRVCWPFRSTAEAANTPRALLLSHFGLVSEYAVLL